MTTAYLGQNAGSSGTYTQNGGLAELDAGKMYVGDSGLGSFKQIAGKADVTSLLVGVGAGYASLQRPVLGLR